MKHLIRDHREQGSVVLVALCFVVILGIALGSYLAVSTQAMKLSNRSYIKGVSGQLAESGLEQALRDFTANDWSSWTIDSANSRASRTITFPAGKYGNGLNGSIKLRVDNYDAYNSSAEWKLNKIYWCGDLVGYNGMWYRCLQRHTSTSLLAPPNLGYWVEAPIPWTWSIDISYKKSTATNRADVVYYVNTTGTGAWYQCIKDSIGNNPPASSTFWTPLLWKATNPYNPGDFVFYNNNFYSCIATPSAGEPPSNAAFWTLRNYTPWEYQTGLTYVFNDVVFFASTPPGAWYRCAALTTTAAPDGGTGDWENALSDSWSWSSSVSYNVNDVVYSVDNFYRCTNAHSNQQPPNSAFWSPLPLALPNWDPGRQYNANDTALYNGQWYLAVSANVGKNPASVSGTIWAVAPKNLSSWSSSTGYNIGDLVEFGATWYRCIASHVNQSPPNTSYWTAVPVSAYAPWSSTTNYVNGNYASYGGVWYQCIAANTNHSPNDLNYWKALGSPVIYTEGVSTIPDGSTSIRTQLRGTPIRAPLFPNAATTTSTLVIKNGGTIDSFDGSPFSKNQGTEQSYFHNQTVPPFSSSPGNNVGYLAVLASSATSSPAISITGTTINGYVAVLSASSAPYAPLWNYGGLTTLASSSSSTGIDLTRVSRSPYTPQFDIIPTPLLTHFTSLDFAKGTAIPNPTSSDSTLILGTPGAVTPSRYYFNSTLRLQSGSPSYYKTIIIQGPVILFVNGSLRIQVGGLLDIKRPGSAEIHCTSFRTYSGSDGILNRSTDPKRLIVISDTNSFTSMYLDNGGSALNSSFCGVWYAPNATTPLDIRTGMKLYGAISARKILFSTEATLHYDTSLQYATFGGVDTPYAISEWRELSDQNEKATIP